MFCLTFIKCVVIIMMVHLATGITIECDSISNYQRGRKYCIIKGVKTTENSTIFYEPSLFATFKTELLFDKCKLYSIPRGIFSAFPRLKTMYTYHSGLVTIRKEDFENAVELRELDASMNLVTELAESTFFGAIDLEYLNLASNRIAILAKLTFFGLIRLKVLRIDGNDIEHLAPGTFDTTPRLEMLYMDHNRIQTIDGQLFLHNVGLLEVHLHCNNISQLNGSAFSHLKRLNSFRANDNPIIGLDYILVDSVYTNIRNIGCAGCYIGNRTEKLLASNNRISYVIVDTVKPKITELDLERNRLTSFRNLSALVNLEELDMSNNRIGDFHVPSFAHLNRLAGLKLRNSGLRSIDFGLFSYKPRLKLLDISQNRLGKIELIKFTGLKNVRSLFLEGNNLTQIDFTGLRQYFPTLAKIGVSQNQWNCTHLALAIKILEANHIELNRVGLTKNRTNIKGIPCDVCNRERKLEFPPDLFGIPIDVPAAIPTLDTEEPRPGNFTTFPDDLDLQTTSVVETTTEREMIEFVNNIDIISPNEEYNNILETQPQSDISAKYLETVTQTNLPWTSISIAPQVPVEREFVEHTINEKIIRSDEHIIEKEQTQTKRNPVLSRPQVETNVNSNKPNIALLVKLVELRLQVNAAAAKVVRISKILHEAMDYVSNS